MCWSEIATNDSIFNVGIPNSTFCTSKLPGFWFVLAIEGTAFSVNIKHKAGRYFDLNDLHQGYDGILSRNVYISFNSDKNVLVMLTRRYI